MGPVATPKMRRYKKSPFALRASSSCTEVWTPTAGCCQVPIGQWRPHPESHRLSEPPVLCASMLSPGSAYGHHLGLETTTALRASAAAILRAGKIFVPTPSFSEVFPNGILGFPEPTVCRPNCRDARLVQCGSNKVKLEEKGCAKSFRLYKFTQNLAKWHITYSIT